MCVVACPPTAKFLAQSPIPQTSTVFLQQGTLLASSLLQNGRPSVYIPRQFSVPKKKDVGPPANSPPAKKPKPDDGKSGGGGSGSGSGDADGGNGASKPNNGSNNNNNSNSDNKNGGNNND